MRAPVRAASPDTPRTVLGGGGQHEVALHRDAHASTTGRAGHAEAGVSARLHAGVQGDARITRDGALPQLQLQGEARTGAGFEQQAQAGLAPLVLGQREIVSEPLTVAQKTHGFAGAKAAAHVSAGPTHAEGRAEAFAGAKTGGGAQLTLGDQRLHVSGDVRAGVGLEAAAAAGLNRTPEGRTRLKLEGRVGGALGVGGAVGGGVDLDVTPVANTIAALPRPATNALKSVGNSIVGAGKAVGDFVRTVVTAPVQFVKALFS